MTAQAVWSMTSLMMGVNHLSVKICTAPAFGEQSSPEHQRGSRLATIADLADLTLQFRPFTCCAQVGPGQFSIHDFGPGMSHPLDKHIVCHTSFKSNRHLLRLDPEEARPAQDGLPSKARNSGKQMECGMTTTGARQCSCLHLTAVILQQK